MINTYGTIDFEELFDSLQTEIDRLKTGYCVYEMYQDKKDGTTVFCGYVIGGLWLQLYEVQPVEKAV